MCDYVLQVQVMKLQDALESSGSYKKAEIVEKVAKFRDKLHQVSNICSDLKLP